MAREQQERQFREHHQPFGIDAMIDGILVVQRAEITKMRGWLVQWAWQHSKAVPRAQNRLWCQYRREFRSLDCSANDCVWKSSRYIVAR